MSQSIKIPLPKGESKEKTKQEVQISTLDGELEITGLPNDASLKYVARADDGEFFVVYDKGPRHIRDLTVLVGSEPELRETEFEKMDTLRDGGTKIFKYILDGKEYGLRFPSPLQRDEKPSVYSADGRKELERLL